MAESFYWIGRYMERVDFTTRLMDVNYHSQQALLGKGNTQEHHKNKLLAAFGNHSFTSQQQKDRNDKQLLEYLTFGRAYENSILSSLEKARQNVRVVRGQLPEKIWDAINSFYLWLKDKEGTEGRDLLPYSLFEQILHNVSLFNGITDSTMLRENEWNFIQAGRFIERSGNSLRMLQLYCDQLVEERESGHNREPLLSILDSLEGLEAFRRYHADQIETEKMVEFLMLNKAFPRSIMFSFTNLEMFLKIIEKDYYLVRYSDLNRLMANMKGNLSTGINFERTSSQDLQLLLNQLQNMVNQIGAEIGYCFFYEGEELSGSTPKKKVAVL